MRRPTIIQTVAGVALLAGMAGVAPAAPQDATVRVKGGEVFRANRMIGSDLRFARDVTSVGSGGTVTIRNPTSEPHTLSLVRRSQLPRTARQVDACFTKGVCADFMRAHEVEGEEQPPKKTLVDVGAAGFDQPGDSIFFGPKSTARIQVTAKPGTTLHFLCVPHPWMQARLKVR